MPDVVVLDLFDTLVDLDLKALPLVDWGEGPRRSTLGALHEVFRQVLAIDLRTFADELRASDEVSIRTNWARDRELTTEERFEAFVDRLGVARDGIVDELTSTHTGWLERIATTPAHHRAVLAQLEGRVRIAICSNFSHSPTAHRILERDGLLPYFASVVVSADVRYRKPHRRIFERVLADLDVGPERVLHVGDRLPQDVGGAAALGERTAWITRRVKDRRAAEAAYDGPPPDHVVADLREIEGLLT